MAKEDLIPHTKGSERAIILGRKGGKAKSIAKNNAQKWRQIKNRLKRDAVTDDDAKWMLEKLENRDAWAVDIMRYIDIIKRDIHPAQRVALGHLMVAGAKFHHGDKIRTENVNINIDVDVDIENVKKHLSQFI